MTTNNVTIEQLAEKLGKTVWSKGDMKRIYLNDAGHNTKKMSTKAYIYEKDGDFRVYVNIDCPSQAYQWIESQEEKVRESILESIENAIATEVFVIVEKDADIALNAISYSDIHYSLESAKKEANENWGSNFEIKTYDRVYFETEVERLDLEYKNLPWKVKFANGDTLSFGKDTFEKRKAELEAEGIINECTVTIYNDGSGNFRLKKEGEKSISEIIEETLKSNAQDEAEKKKIQKKITNQGKTTYGIGSKVKHSRFGEGTVITEDAEKIEITFTEGTKNLLKKFVTLEVL